MAAVSDQPSPLSSSTSTENKATLLTYQSSSLPLPPPPPSSVVHSNEDIPIPPTVPATGISIQAHKLWIGNLDKRLTQQNILKFTTPYGRIVSFKYMCHTAGVEKGEPRGYCFIEYSTREEAERAKQAMNGKVALGQTIFVDWARPDQYLKKIGATVSETWDASTVSATLQGGASTAAKIAALEAKLLQMDGGDISTTNTTTGSSTHHTHKRQSHSSRRYSAYYSQEHVRRKHGGNIKIQRPQKVHNNRTDLAVLKKV